MSKLEIIDSILHESYKDNSNILIERNTDNRGKAFVMQRRVIAKRNVNYSIYRYDKQTELFPFFKGTGVSKLKKMCDYVLFIEEGEHLFTYLVELKKGTESAKNQLDAAECFVKYVIATTNRLELDLDITENNFHLRKIRVSESKSNKKTLKKGIIEKENGVIEHENSKDFHIEQYLTY